MRIAWPHAILVGIPSEATRSVTGTRGVAHARCLEPQHPDRIPRGRLHPDSEGARFPTPGRRDFEDRRGPCDRFLNTTLFFWTNLPDNDDEHIAHPPVSRLRRELIHHLYVNSSLQQGIPANPKPQARTPS